MIFELTGTPLRIAGTLHLLPPGRDLPAWVRSAYDWSDAVFVEHSPADFLREAQRIDEPLDHVVSPVFWSRLQMFASSLPLPLAGLQRGAAVVLGLGSRLQGAPGADQALGDWCARDGKPFGCMEPATELLEALASIGEAQWLAGLDAEHRLAGDPRALQAQLQRFYDSWRKGKLDGIVTASTAGLFSVPAIRARLLTGRNAAWAARYAEPSRPTLVAVGAAHLVGEGSFLQALAQVSGRSVRRLV